MKWILILMIFGEGNGNISASTVPHKFNAEIECKAFVAQLRKEHESKRIDASCIAVNEEDRIMGG